MAKKPESKGLNNTNAGNRRHLNRHGEAKAADALRDNSGRFTSPDADTDKPKRGGKAGGSSRRKPG